MDRLSIINLKGFLRERNLDTSGSRSELGNRLIEALEKENIDVNEFIIEKMGEPSQIQTRSMIRHEKVGQRVYNLDTPREVTVEPGDSASQSGRSGRSNRTTSSVTRQRQMATAKKAALEVKMAKLRELDELERAETESKQKRIEQEMKYQQEKRRLELDTDYGMAVAEERALSELECNQNLVEDELKLIPRDFEGVESVRKWVDSNDQPIKEEKYFCGNGQEFSGPDPLNTALVSGNSRSNKENSLMNALVSCNLKNLMPNQKINIFDGDYTSYFLFKNSFDNVINTNLTNDRERLQYLEQFTRGRPNEIVRACLHLPPTKGYKRARESLDARYGNSNRVVQAFVEKVLDWKNIQRDDIEGLDDFAVMLSSCNNAVSGVPHGSAVLNNPDTMRKIISKLPFNMQDRWRRLADEIMQNKKKEISFDDLVQFIDKETRIIKNPYFGKHLFDGTEKIRSSEIRNTKLSRNVEEGFRKGQRNDNNGQRMGAPFYDRKLNVNNTKTGLSCWFCKGSHLVDDCSEINRMSHENRLEVIKNLNLCFSCLRGGHTSRNCGFRKKCSVCGMNHPTLLHRQTHTFERSCEEVNLGSLNKKEEISNKVSIYINRENRNSKGMSVVPVKVRSSEGHEVETMAFLDGGSSGTFCTGRLLERLGISAGNCDKIGVTTTTMHGDKKDVYSIVSGLIVSDLQNTNSILLPPVYIAKSIPIEKCDIVNKNDLVRWPHLERLDLPFSNEDVELMIGNNVPHALEPWDVINSKNDYEPHAIRTRLGWIVCGAGSSNDRSMPVNRMSISKGIKLDKLMIEEYNRDFQDLSSSKKELSVEDRAWLGTADRECKRLEGKYEIPLPLRSNIVDLPDSKPAALKRLQSLRKKLVRDVVYAEQYCKFMDDMLSNKYAEQVECDPDVKQGDYWYIPHFGVTHPDKPGKVRVVFDCAAKVEGLSLNDLLIQGPDMINSLICVLLSFRVGCYAYTSDIETMFYQVRVPNKHRDYLRFLWWNKNDFTSEPREFRMCVHLFGASSSPNIANYALKRISNDEIEGFSDKSRETMKRNFYVDDLLRSEDTPKLLVENAVEVSELCRRGGFNLTKFCSNDLEFLKEIPTEKLHKNAIEVLKGNYVINKTLGVFWYLKSDEIGVCIENLTIPETKRELLSCIASLYDPIGVVAPLILEGRLIMQDLCRLQINWDNCIAGVFKKRVEIWINKVIDSRSTRVRRCIKPVHADNILYLQLHYFSDASQLAYGAVSYLRIVDRTGNKFCVFVMGKGRVAPLKIVSIPRLELTAATIAVKMNSIIRESLNLVIRDTFYWTDSTTVLRYILNDRLRYQTFVANRVSLIRDGSSKEQWRYIRTELNPADDASRARQTERWCRGPEFLLKNQDQWPLETLENFSKLDDLEIKCDIFKVDLKENNQVLVSLLERYSEWLKLIRAVAWLIKFKNYLLQKIKSHQIVVLSFGLSTDLLSIAEDSIVKIVQREFFSLEIARLEKEMCVSRKSSLIKLKPIFSEGILRVGGRLDASNLEFQERCPAILPYRSHVTDLIISYFHVKMGHMGRATVLSAIRSKYWIVKGNSAVRRVLGGCIICKKVQGQFLEQQMAPLPSCRVESDHPPFYTTGVDCFGPFYVKRGRTQVKRYGVIFTCLSVRAVHLEVAADMSTDSFINALRRFLARRGQVKKIKCDKGTNFVGTSNVMKDHIDDFEKVNKIKNELMNRGIIWEFNPPTASHFGGAWERMIRTFRRILESLMGMQVMDDDSIQTLFCEIEAIINSRPLSVVSSDAKDVVPITPFKLLCLGEAPVKIGEVENSDCYSRRRWKQVQYLADQFWRRWKKEYLVELQKRQKWFKKQRNVKVGDIVLMMYESRPRCHWPLAKVTDVKYSRDGLVRSVWVKSESKLYERPLTKLIMVLEDEEVSEN